MVVVRGRFPDPEMERKFSLTERQSQIPMVRWYAALTIAVMLIYGLVDPLFFSLDDQVRFTILLPPTLGVLGAYVGLTYWEKYGELPLIDFVCLSAIGLLVLGENSILWDEAATFEGARHASVAINTSLVTAFAAIVLADRLRWFVWWLALALSNQMHR